ncbi:aminotransferase class III-fold pyridoxal phosphate-dependent enzyme [Seohaeicola nanhaiensis]|uniref:Aminotransferase class III-fold pyridoxal phosphate-dependent enzyme n=1 Tax=Seohaeicola nanhaiensis TaxID=1387282 RepID=A0ABV9KKT7_9RHOB
MSQLYPFTDPVAQVASPPTVMREGRGCRVTDTAGREYLDALSGLWCASLGFSSERLIAAAERQMRQLPYYHSFMGQSAEPAERLAAKLAEILPGNLNHLLFGCTGSDAVDSAVKLVRFYWNSKGQPERKRIIAREAAYHGSGVSSASLTSMAYCHERFDLPDAFVLRTGRPHYFRDGEPGESEIAFSKRRASELDVQIRQVGPETVGAFIGEPVIGSGGVLPPLDGYWDEIQNVLARYGILLIADEIITGFGRTGAWFASEKYGIRPDLMTLAKQLTGAYFPLSG